MEYEYPIVVKNLRKVFKPTFGSKRPEKVAVDDISFNVRKGEVFGLLGPNGAGKTTIIKMMSTLLIPTSGKVEILGMDITGKDEKEIRKKINLVSGGERGLYYRLTGRQNLRFFADLYNIPHEEQKTILPELLETVGLTEAADVKVEDYSRGMKQRMHIARALVNRPEILYLDEPTIGLDPEIAREVRGLVKKMVAAGTTVVLTTHYMYEAEALCNRIMIISKGKTVGYGTVAELKSTVADTNILVIVTERDPNDAVAMISNDARIIGVSSDVISGRHTVRIHINGNEDMLTELDGLFSEYVIKKIGYDEPTLEDTYLSLVGHK